MKKVLTSAALITMTLIGTTTQVFAMDYDSATQGRSEATVNLKITDSEIVNPEPGGPEIEGPKEPGTPNPYPGELKIDYVSDYDFGKWEYTGHTLNVNAKKDTNFINSTTGDEVELAPFVAVQDIREISEDASAGNWTLKAQIKENFKNNQSELKGAKVTLNTMAYDALTEANETSTINKVVEVNPGTPAKIVVDADNMTGKNSIGFDPATLTIPSGLNNEDELLENGVYATEMFWTLESGV